MADSKKQEKDDRTPAQKVADEQFKAAQQAASGKSSKS